MPTIIGAIISAGLKWVLSCFMPSKDEKLGKLEVKNADQAEIIKEDQTAMAAADAVDRSDDAAAEQLRAKLNNRP
jgi:hypothetical protein